MSINQIFLWSHLVIRAMLNLLSSNLVGLLLFMTSRGAFGVLNRVVKYAYLLDLINGSGFVGPNSKNEG